MNIELFIQTLAKIYEKRENVKIECIVERRKDSGVYVQEEPKQRM